MLGTGLLALIGIKLPGIEFFNQRVEAAYRKELVLGEDNEARADPPTLHRLFGDIRRNYFRLYLNFLTPTSAGSFICRSMIFAYILLVTMFILVLLLLGSSTRCCGLEMSA